MNKKKNNNKIIRYCKETKMIPIKNQKAKNNKNNQNTANTSTKAKCYKMKIIKMSRNFKRRDR